MEAFKTVLANNTVGTILGMLMTGIVGWALTYIREEKKMKEHIKRICDSYEKEKKEQDVIANAMRSNLRHNIVNAYYMYTQQGYIPEYALTSIISMYEDYKALGGNGAVDALIKELKKMPHIKQKKRGNNNER